MYIPEHDILKDNTLNGRGGGQFLGLGYWTENAEKDKDGGERLTGVAWNCVEIELWFIWNSSITWFPL